MTGVTLHGHIHYKEIYARTCSGARNPESLNLKPQTLNQVFNWRADGWGPGEFKSETHNWGGAGSGRCVLAIDSNGNHSHFIGFGMQGIDECRRVLATLHPAWLPRS